MHPARDPKETWEQLKRSLNVGREVLRDEQLHSWFLDPDIPTSTPTPIPPRR